MNPKIIEPFLILWPVFQLVLHLLRLIERNVISINHAVVVTIIDGIFEIDIEVAAHQLCA